MNVRGLPTSVHSVPHLITTTTFIYRYLRSLFTVSLEVLRASQDKFHEKKPSVVSRFYYSLSILRTSISLLPNISPCRVKRSVLIVVFGNWCKLFLFTFVVKPFPFPSLNGYLPRATGDREEIRNFRTGSHKHCHATVEKFSQSLVHGLF